MKGYFVHLIKNWKVAGHALNDFAQHFMHGLVPCISWKHHHSEDSE